MEVFCSIDVCFDKDFILQNYKINLLFANILTKKSNEVVLLRVRAE